jgi:type IV secretion system protein TrbL
MEFNSLTTTLTHFISAFSGAHDRLLPVINGLLASLLAIEIVLIGLWWALGGNEQIVSLFKKILFIGFWIWITTSFPTLAKAFVDSLIRAGLLAGGRPGDLQLLLDPSRIAGYGLDATEPLSKALDGVGWDVADAIIFGLSYLVIMASFLAMAIQVFLAVLEYYLLLAVVGILMPFGILPQTKFLAEKAIGAIVSSGIKLMVLAFVMAVAEPTLAGIHFAGPEIKFNELFAVILTCGAIAFLSWNAPGLAAGLLAGSPSLSAAGAAQGATAGAMLASGVVGGMVGATRAATSFAGAAATGLSKAAGIGATGATLGAAASSGGPLARAAAGAAGAARALGGAAVQAMASPFKRAGEAVSSTYRDGEKAGFGASGGKTGDPSGATKTAAQAESVGVAQSSGAPRSSTEQTPHVSSHARSPKPAPGWAAQAHQKLKDPEFDVPTVVSPSTAVLADQVGQADFAPALGRTSPGAAPVL